MLNRLPPGRFCDGIPSRKAFLLRALSILISLRGRRKKGRGGGGGGGRKARERGREKGASAIRAGVFVFHPPFSELIR